MSSPRNWRGTTAAAVSLASDMKRFAAVDNRLSLLIIAGDYLLAIAVATHRASRC